MIGVLEQSGAVVLCGSCRFALKFRAIGYRRSGCGCGGGGGGSASEAGARDRLRLQPRRGWAGEKAELGAEFWTLDDVVILAMLLLLLTMMLL